jgi:superfamily I DNA/RNA helicase
MESSRRSLNKSVYPWVRSPQSLEASQTALRAGRESIRKRGGAPRLQGDAASVEMSYALSMPERPDIQAELAAAIDRILASKNPKKLIVAGPGAGKTYLFKELLNAAAGDKTNRLVLTFISNLKADLERNLGELSSVFTLHGYCQSLLRRDKKIRDGLSKNVRCHPGLCHLVPQDWIFLRGMPVPAFVQLMRTLDCKDEHRDFCLGRGNYYDAIDFDDSVYRALTKMTADKTLIPNYELVLIDEFQDFNRMETSIVDLLSEKNPVVIAGDDDQALYSQLRSASWDHIRERYESGHYEVFELPFCMRCPEAIVGAVNDVIKKAQDGKNLNGRIPKPYRYFEPIKGVDSARYPKIDLVETTVQRNNANYFGRYIEKCIKEISVEDVKSAAENNEPVALVIGSNPYRRSVEEHLIKVGLIKQASEDELSERQKALQILNQDPGSNLGWRIILAVGNQDNARAKIRDADQKHCNLVDVIPFEQREAVLAEAKTWAAAHKEVDFGEERQQPVQNIAITSYEGSKGRSAQYVFLIGVHSGEIPRRADNIEDIEICRFLVGLTRTKKKCSILHAGNAMGQFKNPSEFIGWIDSSRFEKKTINAEYWNS